MRVMADHVDQINRQLLFSFIRQTAKVSIRSLISKTSKAYFVLTAMRALTPSSKNAT